MRRRRPEARVMALKATDKISDWKLLKQSLVVLTLVILGFIFARQLNLEPATIAITGAAVLMLLDNWVHHSEKAAHNVHQTFGDVEWITIFFFIGLFIVVHGRRGRRPACSARRQTCCRNRWQPRDHRLRDPVGVRRSVRDRR